MCSRCIVLFFRCYSSVIAFLWVTVHASCCCLWWQMIPPRGCAYVCFNTRKEAAKAKDTLKYVRLMTNLLKVCCLTLAGLVQFRARCTSVVQLWPEVKVDFDTSSAVMSIEPMRFKRWSRFNSEPPSDLRSNVDLGSNSMNAGISMLQLVCVSKEITWFES